MSPEAIAIQIIPEVNKGEGLLEKKKSDFWK